jgi:hypothetical protein
MKSENPQIIHRPPKNQYFFTFYCFSFLCRNIVMGAASFYFLFFQILEHYAVWLEDLFGFSKQISCTYFYTNLPETFRMFCEFQVLFYFYSWDDPANLRNRKVRTLEKRGMNLVPCVANLKRWLQSLRQ